MTGTTVGHYEVPREARRRRHGRGLQGPRPAAEPDGGAQVPATRQRRDGREAPPLPAGSAGGLGAEPPGHRHDLRSSEVGPRRLHRDGTRPGASAGRRDRKEAAAACESHRLRHPDRGCPRGRARRRDRAPRSQARQRDDCRLGPDQSARLRPGEGGGAAARRHRMRPGRCWT